MTDIGKILLNNSTPEQMPIQDGAPTMDAVSCVDHDTRTVISNKNHRSFPSQPTAAEIGMISHRHFV